MIRQKKEKARAKGGQRGFTLIETTIALLIMMIVMLGAASVFAYATLNNSNGEDRAQTLAFAQEIMEAYRSLRFSSAGTDSKLNATPNPPSATMMRRGAAGASGRQYSVLTTIVDTTPTVKTITVSVTPVNAGQAWASSANWGTVTLVTQRAKSDQP